MFSMTSNILQSQVVLPISYAISQCSTFRPRTRPVQKQSETKSSIDSNKLNSSSNPVSELSLTLKDVEFSKYLANGIINSSMLHNFALTGTMNKFSNITEKPTLYSNIGTNWRESHISQYSFDDNKKVFMNQPLNSCQNVVLSRKIMKKLSSCFTHGAVRGFKTRHSLDKRIVEQHDFVDRFKQGLKLKDSSMNIDSETKHKLGKLLKEESTEEAQKSIKIAFAEGYLAAEPKKQTSRLMKIMHSFQNIVIFITVISLIFVVWGSLGGSMFRMHVNNGSEVRPDDINVSFSDVKGAEEAKDELQEIVQFLKNPQAFTSLGAELPKGVLLVGPPGTGKTLLARAIAGEAGVPFFHAAGPEFDEILVGQGARRVRDLFLAAKLKAPCVIFIDEIDSVGAKRTNSVLHPYANQTINQLLSEMDGFHENEGVIVLGATNRRDDLDKALLRPGRFDVEVQVPVPDLAGRKEIFDYYLGKVKKGQDVDIGTLGRGTTGFTGADIKNVVNQAALRAAADHVDSVTMKYLEEARDKVLMGPEKKSRIPDEEANLITAYHEGGHTLVAFYTQHAPRLHKVTIIPRGPALGHTAYIPDKEQYHMTKSQMLASMDSLMGGRAAEELIFGIDMMTTGAASDLKKATSLATMMVKDVGMSDKVGLRTFENTSNQLLKSGDSLGQSTKEAIDAEIKRILQESYDRAKTILKAHSKEHKALAEALMKYETLDSNDIKSILDGKTVEKNV